MPCPASCLKTLSSAWNNQPWVPQNIILTMILWLLFQPTKIWVQVMTDPEKPETPAICMKFWKHHFSATTSWLHSAVALPSFTTRLPLTASTQVKIQMRSNSSVSFCTRAPWWQTKICCTQVRYRLTSIKNSWLRVLSPFLRNFGIFNKLCKSFRNWRSKKLFWWGPVRRNGKGHLKELKRVHCDFITEYPELERTHEDHQVHIFSIGSFNINSLSIHKAQSKHSTGCSLTGVFQDSRIQHNGQNDPSLGWKLSDFLEMALKPLHTRSLESCSC